MEKTHAELSRVITEIAQITPLTPGGNNTQSWPIGMFLTRDVLCFLLSKLRLLKFELNPRFVYVLEQ